MHLAAHEIQQGSLFVEPSGLKVGTSFKIDCKSVSSPVNGFCGDFLNTLINMV